MALRLVRNGGAEVTTCVKCGEEVTSPRNAWREVRGWTKPRNQGGDNSLSLRNPTGRLMHEACMSAEKSRVSPGHTSLV
jgi:hypothetical protein